MNKRNFKTWPWILPNPKWLLRWEKQVTFPGWLTSGSGMKKKTCPWKYWPRERTWVLRGYTLVKMLEELDLVSLGDGFIYPRWVRKVGYFDSLWGFIHWLCFHHGFHQYSHASLFSSLSLSLSKLTRCGLEWPPRWLTGMELRNNDKNTFQIWSKWR